MVIEGARPGKEFQLTNRPSTCAPANFIALTDGKAVVTRRLTDILGLPDETPVVANWHGTYRTDAFSTTVGDLRAKADSYSKN